MTYKRSLDKKLCVLSKRTIKSAANYNVSMSVRNIPIITRGFSRTSTGLRALL